MTKELADAIYNEILQTAIQATVHQQDHVEELVRARIRIAVCRRFPDYTYEEIVADVHNARVLWGLEQDLIRNARNIIREHLQALRQLSRTQQAS